MRTGSVAVPSGDLYPNGLIVTAPNPSVQSTVHVPGTFFKESPGHSSLRPGRYRLQKGYHGTGIHFTPHRFAEDMGAETLPMLVDADTAVKGADIAELPGSERLDDEGKTTREEDRVLLAESNDAPTASESVSERHEHTRDLTGIRNLRSETVRYSRGLLLNPVDFISDEYRKTPEKAVAIAAGITWVVYMIGREFDRSVNRRRRRSVPAAAVAATGSTAATVVETPAKVVEAVAENVGDVVEEVTEAITETVD